MLRVKVCCIGSIDEARTAVRLGASAVGLVSEMPSGPGVIPDDRIAQISATVPDSVATFLLTSRTNPADIAEQWRETGVTTVQLCDRLADGAHAELRALLPDVELVQVVHVNGEESVVEAAGLGPKVDALLLDSGNQGLAVKELGGTGRAHDWGLSARIVEDSPVPVYLAGGLNAGNVADAVRIVRPNGVDLCTGVREDGRLSEKRLREFMRAVETREAR